jgi:hypothetical protein
MDKDHSNLSSEALEILKRKQDIYAEHHRLRMENAKVNAELLEMLVKSSTAIDASNLLGIMSW